MSDEISVCDESGPNRVYKECCGFPSVTHTKTEGNSPGVPSAFGSLHEFCDTGYLTVPMWVSVGT